MGGGFLATTRSCLADGHGIRFAIEQARKEQLLFEAAADLEFDCLFTKMIQAEEQELQDEMRSYYRDELFHLDLLLSAALVVKDINPFSQHGGLGARARRWKNTGKKDPHPA